MHVLSRAFLVSVTSIAFGAASAAADFKVGTVEMARVLREAPEAKTGLKEISKLRDNAEDQLKDQFDDLKPRLEKLRGDKSASGEERAKLLKKQKELVRLEQDKKEELNRKVSELRRKVLKRSITAIKQIAEEKKIDLVLYKGEGEVDRGPILYGHEKFDLTDAVIAKLGK